MNDGASTTASHRPPPSNRFRLLNGKFNGSSDNLSIMSTVSSASVMIRKIGQMGKLARRNSLMGLTKAFKRDKKGDEYDAVGADVASNSKLSKKDNIPAGMSPAAALARQQQLAYAQQEAAEERARQAAAAEAARLGPPKRSFEQLSTHQHSSSVASDASSIRSGGRSDKPPKARNSFGLKNRFGLGGSKTDLREAAAAQSDTASTYSAYAGSVGTAGQFDDPTPRQSLEVLAAPHGSEDPHGTYGTYEWGTESQEYEPSLFREGAQPKPVSGPPKGILKGECFDPTRDFQPDSIV